MVPYRTVPYRSLRRHDTGPVPYGNLYSTDVPYVPVAYVTYGTVRYGTGTGTVCYISTLPYRTDAETHGTVRYRTVPYRYLLIRLPYRTVPNGTEPYHTDCRYGKATVLFLIRPLFLFKESYGK